MLLGNERGKNSSSREKIDAVESSDDFAANHQLLQIVAIAQFFVGHEAKPEIVRGKILLPRFNHQSRIEHVPLRKQRTCQGCSP
jgi:hypothetical protein